MRGEIGEPERQRIAEPENALGMPSLQLHDTRVEAVKIKRQAGDWQQTIRAVFGESHKQTESRDAADPAGEYLANPPAEPLSRPRQAGSRTA